jgi:hypothetical protein
MAGNLGSWEKIWQIIKIGEISAIIQKGRIIFLDSDLSEKV